MIPTSNCAGRLGSREGVARAASIARSMLGVKFGEVRRGSRVAIPASASVVGVISVNRRADPRRRDGRRRRGWQQCRYR